MLLQNGGCKKATKKIITEMSHSNIENKLYGLAIRLRTIHSELDKLHLHFKPTFDGEIYITDRELAERLKVNRRSLSEYRKIGILPYYHIGGKILYKEPEIKKLLDENYYSIFSK